MVHVSVFGMRRHFEFLGKNYLLLREREQRQREKSISMHCAYNIEKTIENDNLKNHLTLLRKITLKHGNILQWFENEN